MRRSLAWMIAGSLGLIVPGLLPGIPGSPRPGAQPQMAAAWVVPWPSSPYQTALREAGFWRAQAIQLASDEQDQEQEAMQVWDPGALLDMKREVRRFLSADKEGYLKRALAALRNAERLAPGTAARARVQRCRQSWEDSAHLSDRQT